MMPIPGQPLRVAIACGGTGGHLFPGLAVAEQLRPRGCEVTLLVSPKQIDQEAARAAAGMRVVTLPAVGLTAGNRWAFVRGLVRSYRLARKLFQEQPHQAALAMGGFTSAPPIWAARRLGAVTFLHESNTVPGRANRWLSWGIGQAFVGFPEAAARLHTRKVMVTGTPVRGGFSCARMAESRAALGLDPSRPVVLITGGSQGARGINQLVIEALPALKSVAADWQWFHLTGSQDLGQVKQAYAAAGVNAVVHPFFAAMDLALSAATVSISRAGASSLAELAAVRLPSVLIPYPAATDNHQYHNARAFERTGAALLLEQKQNAALELSEKVVLLVRDLQIRTKMQEALAGWHTPTAAGQMAEAILAAVARGQMASPSSSRKPPPETAPGAGEPYAVRAANQPALRAQTQE